MQCNIMFHPSQSKEIRTPMTRSSSGWYRTRTLILLIVVLCILKVMHVVAFTHVTPVPQARFMSGCSRKRRRSCLFSDVTGTVDRHSGILTPEKIKHPEFYLSEEEDRESNRNSEGNGVPLGIALSRLKNSLQDIKESYLQRNVNPFLLEKVKKSTKVLADGSILLRIEQIISSELEMQGGVDPILWLRNQYDAHKFAGRAVCYFSDAEGYTDVAAIGSMHTLTGDGDMTEEEWKIIKSIPKGVRYYGGSRFDTCYPKERRDKMWDPYGGHYFILPAIELRKESSRTNTHEQESFVTDGNVMNDAEDILPVVETASSTFQKNCYETQIAINLRYGEGSRHLSILDAVDFALGIIDDCLAGVSSSVAPLLPPILNIDDSENEEYWENGVNTALSRICDDKNFEVADTNFRSPGDSSVQSLSPTLTKVVLARRADLHVSDSLHPLDPLMRYKLSGHFGHFLLFQPERSSPIYEEVPVLVSCTPERLFRVDTSTIQTEALAGTRPRGLNPTEDAFLLKDLMSSSKDISENQITSEFISDAFEQLARTGFVETENFDDIKGYRFVRRLRHLQHICQQFKARKCVNANVIDTAKEVMKRLHPTPAMCGMPVDAARNFIRSHEPFDRGFYAGPFGYLGMNSCDMVVSIRSGLLTFPENPSSSVVLSTFAGAGIVPGSTAQDEWKETQIKLNVIRSLFPSAPVTLRGLPNANYGWATAIVEELIRCGITNFMVCPGSRSTALTAMLAKAARKNVGSIRVVSVHDERGAAFRCVGSARATGRPAVVVTSSGTAVANLYPAVMEASNDGIPMIILTADRPYEARGTGANQAVDQVKVFGDRVRWFRDIPPPSDDVPVSVGLSDISHAVDTASSLMGPVHLNIQFRENLAPDSGQVRGDDRVDSIESFNVQRFTDAPGFKRWSFGASRWQESYLNGALAPAVDSRSLRSIANILSTSRRCIIVVGNIRGMDYDAISMISHAAKVWGIPIFADIQASSLRNSDNVVPFIDFLLKHPKVVDNISPDVILQIGHPIISVEVQKLIKSSLRNTQSQSSFWPAHILLHPHYGNERADPSFTVTHRVSCNVGYFLNKLVQYIDDTSTHIHSELLPLVELGTSLGESMPNLIHKASIDVCERSGIVGAEGIVPLTEPQVILAVNNVISKLSGNAMFLSNSMPVRDADAFMFPIGKGHQHPTRVAVNRGASGIDGVLSTAAEYSSSLQTPTTLIVGDVATLHDLNAMHTISADTFPTSSSITTIIVNNNGGGIFSFLPISKHGDDVGFDQYFGTPTDSFSFQNAAEAANLSYRSSTSFDNLQRNYYDALHENKHSIIEANVVGRDINVAVHAEISKLAVEKIDEILYSSESERNEELIDLNIKEITNNFEKDKTMLLLHGWLGSGEEWDATVLALSASLPEWRILTIDLPGHGKAKPSFINNSIDSLLKPSDSSLFKRDYSIDGLAEKISEFLHLRGISKLDAVCGYSLGGRVGLAMLRHSLTGYSKLLSEDTIMVLISSNPGDFNIDYGNGSSNIGDDERTKKDDMLASKINDVFIRGYQERQSHVWSTFLNKWYSADLWGDIKQSPSYADMIIRRARHLSSRGGELSTILKYCSPSRNSQEDWKFISPESTLFISGTKDKKYTSIGEKWRNRVPLQTEKVTEAGHALLVEAPLRVANIISEFVKDVEKRSSESSSAIERLSIPTSSYIPDQSSNNMISLSQMDFELFSVSLGEQGKANQGVFGLGWKGYSRPTEKISTRRGILLSIASSGTVGIGEVSPLKGLHPESLDVATEQLKIIKEFVNNESNNLPKMDGLSILRMNGSLRKFIDNIIKSCGINPQDLCLSVRSGLEMSLISLASQNESLTIPEAIAEYSISSKKDKEYLSSGVISLNGISTRVPQGSIQFYSQSAGITFESVKVKVGHRSLLEDASFVAATSVQTSNKIRPDANRSWSKEEASRFSNLVKSFGGDVNRIEFIEEPLEVQGALDDHIEELEGFYLSSGLTYALDESIAQIVEEEEYDLALIERRLKALLLNKKGCAAFVLKPALIGIEMSLNLGIVASDLGLASVISSSFDSGVGLSYASYIALVSDSISKSRDIPTFAHGLGTFTMLRTDTITPNFSTFVSITGNLDVLGLAESLQSLSLDETAIKKRGIETTIQASISLPFSSEVACARFADWPQQPRWSPWLSSVSYVNGSEDDSETEWTLNVRGIRLQWRAVSVIQSKPSRVIWESISGLRNKGTVDFVPTSKTSCTMIASITFVPPRPIAIVFKNNEFLKSFLVDKLLNWSLEMFRDVVRSDFALERGDTELGDALFDAVEGKASVAALLLRGEGDADSEWQ